MVQANLGGGLPTMRPRPTSKKKRKKVALPPIGVVALNRMGFGPRPGDLAAFAALGSTDDERLQAYVDQQLDPDSIDDSATDARIAGAGYTTLGKTRRQLWEDHLLGSESSSLPRREVERVTLLRAIHSKRQLFEVLADFWHDHFNVYRDDYWARSTFVHYSRDVIRANLLGNFRTMLEGVARSAAMLHYLDNYTSSNAGPNENYARELFELHTLGAQNYLGILQQNEVPLDAQNRPVGYVDADVFEATRALTGWTAAHSSYTFGANTGEFLYWGAWHDHFQKTVLGVFMPANQGDLEDGRQVLDALATHPGTAQHICTKLCRRLISDQPPQAVVDSAAAIFESHITAPDQLRRVVRHILLSNEFRSTWGEKVKRPFEFAVAAMRAADTDFVPAMDDHDTDSFFWLFDRCGQPLFGWPAPNGYPDVRQAWQSTTPRVQGWRLVNWLMTFDDDQDRYHLDVVNETPNGRRTATEIANYWINRVLARPVSAELRTELIDFMGQGLNPDLDLPLNTSSSTRARLRALVGLIFMSPDFLYK